MLVVAVAAGVGLSAVLNGGLPSLGGAPPRTGDLVAAPPARLDPANWRPLRSMLTVGRDDLPSSTPSGSGTATAPAIPTSALGLGGVSGRDQEEMLVAQLGSMSGRQTAPRTADEPGEDALRNDQSPEAEPTADASPAEEDPTQPGGEEDRPRETSGDEDSDDPPSEEPEPTPLPVPVPIPVPELPAEPV